ncbi:hypothetical protein [Phocaeicola vulgatus]|uniref:hypothetical protein n=1 Tax=Phocaeicola vulgatus TaxID=821 RepID=UPI001E61DB06|nr:hypothetical protein [Phocaeicola vulgatus]
MGILKDAILAAIQQEHPDAHWVENEKTHMIESTAQAKYNDVRRVERNYTKGVHKARKEAHNGNIVTVQDIYRCDSCKAASDEFGRGCKHGMLFPLILIMGNFKKCMNYEFDAEKVKLQLKRKEAK